MPTVGVATRVIATAYKAASRFPSLRRRQPGATGPATPLPDGGLITYAAGIITFDPLAPRNALDDGAALDVAGISEVDAPYINLAGVAPELAAALATVQLPAGRVLAFTHKEQ